MHHASYTSSMSGGSAVSGMTPRVYAKARKAWASSTDSTAASSRHDRGLS
jgi:hypothetical protein